MIERVAEDARTAIVLEDLAGADVVHVFGEIDTYNAPQLEAVIARTRPEVPLVADLTDCAYLDSAVLSVLVRTRQQRGSNLRVVVRPDSTARRVFRITGLDVAMSIYSTLTDALEQRGHVEGNVLAGSPTWFRTA